MYKSKKILGILMLIIIAAPLFFYSYFFIQQKIVQYKMRCALEKNNLQTIIVNANEIVWEEEGEELIIDGKLFDVKSFKEKDGKLELNGLYDLDELALKEKVEKLLEQRKENKNPTHNLVLKFIDIAAIVPQCNFEISKNTLTKIDFILKNQSSYSFSINVEPPPPIV